MRGDSEWFAIRTSQDFRAETTLRPLLDDVLFPKETVVAPGRKPRERAIIPHVLFIRTSRERALDLEKEGREHPGRMVPFWIYRYPNESRIQPIPGSSIHLLRLLTGSETARCEIYSRTDFQARQRVRITGGPFAGYTGHVVRVRKNKHVVVQIEGICLIMLPYIHPDLLETI